MKQLDIPVQGGTLRALKFGDGEQIIVAAHGITASAMGFGAVARALPDGWSLVALDLRGRGDSNALPGPFGIDQHARDICAVAKALGPQQVVLTGQSMGAYAALRAAVAQPELFERLVLIDGGLPLPVPPGLDPDVVLEATVGPAVARLSQTFPTEESYVDFFKVHPALADDWSEDIEAYVRYDLAGEPGAFRSKVNPVAVRQDGRDLFLEAASYGEDLMALQIPALLLYAPRGMLGQEGGLMAQPVVEHWAATAPRLSVELVPDTNHYTILMTAQAAAILAQRLTSAGG
jgi:pimeloyl-ACP methyl ester carboxylesterase